VRNFDVILVDNAFGSVQRGIELVRYVRLSVSENLPIVVITGDMSEKDRAEYKSYGVSSFIQKPAAPDVSLGVVRDAIKMWFAVNFIFRREHE